MNSKQKARAIGHKLLEGPRAILPPNVGYDWLEKDISVYVHYFQDTRKQQISLWSDSTINKESNFLKPVIRFAHWEQQNNFEKENNIHWPDVRVLLGYIKEDSFDHLNKALIAVQEAIPALHFKPLGISLARDVADIALSEQNIHYEIYIRNGAQSITYYSPVLADDEFSNNVLKLKNLMLQSMEQFDPSGWKERYDSPFNTMSFDWDYKTIKGR